MLEKGDKVIELEVKNGMKARNADRGIFVEKFQPDDSPKPSLMQKKDCFGRLMGIRPRHKEIVYCK